MIFDSVPQSLVAGDTWRVQRSFADYAAPTWVVTYYFENSSKQFSQAAAASGTDHLLTISATTSADLPPGRYRWFARAVSGSISETIEDENGWVDVLPDPAAAGTRDHRSFARRALDAVEAAIEGKASSAQQSFAIGSRTVSSYTITELLQLRKDMRSEVRSEEGRPGGGRTLRVRFDRA